jgi:hypothetical protein
MYSFYPDFIKAILIIIIHSYFLSYYLNSNISNNINLHSTDKLSFKFNINKVVKNHSENYCFSTVIKYLLKEKHFKNIVFGLIILFLIEIILFMNRIKLWVFLNKKEKTLPISSFRNSTFYITSNVVNIENIIDNYIQQLKFLIDYLGEKNVIISIVENEDSKDNTRKILKDFQNYLEQKNILS